MLSVIPPSRHPFVRNPTSLPILPHKSCLPRRFVIPNEVRDLGFAGTLCSFGLSGAAPILGGAALQRCDNSPTDRAGL
jgi:hypothetical protein